MFRRIGELSVRRRWWVIGASLVFVAVAAVMGGGVFGRLSGGGFDDPSAESSRAKATLEERFDTGAPTWCCSSTRTHRPATPPSPSVDAPDVTAAADQLLAELSARDDVERRGPATGRSAGCRRCDPRTATRRSSSPASAATRTRSTHRRRDPRRASPATAGPITVSGGRSAPVFHAVSTRSRPTSPGRVVRRADHAGPAGARVRRHRRRRPAARRRRSSSVIGTFFTLWLITQFTDVSIFSINLVTAHGPRPGDRLLAVHRLAGSARSSRAGRTVEAAVVRTVETAGRTIAVSALTVAVSLSALLVFPLYFLRSFAYAGVGVTLVAMVASIVMLPALLAVLGHRVDALRLPAEARAQAVGERLLAPHRRRA